MASASSAETRGKPLQSAHFKLISLCAISRFLLRESIDPTGLLTVVAFRP